MSYLKKQAFAVLVCTLAALAVPLMIGCSDPNLQSGFDPETGRHVASWYFDHQNVYLATCTTCGDCHGEDLQGGISQVSCFSATLNGISCHPSGQFTGHPSQPWNQHGATAKAAPGACSGFSYCQGCHGVNFAGGTSGQTCLNSTASCHSAAAPHLSNWSSAHRSASEGNAPICGLCHLGYGNFVITPYTPVPSTVVPGCFNNTLCHSED